MSNRTVIWILATLAILLIVGPLLWMSGMVAMMAGTGMMSMHGLGLAWILIAAAVVVALIVALFRATTRA